MKRKDYQYFNRELSWLSFSYRVLQEAKDPRVPLYERIKFLAIFSSNLDEFFRVRVASLKGLLNLKKKAKKKLEIHPADLLKEIKKTVHRQQEEFGSIFRKQILSKLNEHGIYLINETELNEEQREFAQSYFRQCIEPIIAPMFISKNKEAPFLQNQSLYLATKLLPKRIIGNPDIQADEDVEYRYAIVEIPSQQLPRFVTLPKIDGNNYIMFLDDIVRLSLPEIFPNHEIVTAYAIKLTRDAELYIEDEFTGDLLEKIKIGLGKRKTGIASRFLYDTAMPKNFLKLLRKTFSFTKGDLVPGARYHNFNDFFSFPDPKFPGLMFEPLPPLRHRVLDAHNSMFDAIRARDFMLYYPYHSFDHVLEFLQEAADDPNVTSMKITLYRVANNSLIVKPLTDAALRGKAVTAFVEVKARFDEESNLRWAEELEKAGVKVLYSLPGLKVHAKMCLVSRNEGNHVYNYLYLSTGNFNEKTAQVYCDLGFFTADQRLTKDAERIFDFISGNGKNVDGDHVIVAPFTMRETFLDLIDNEINHARHNNGGYMILKMNSLEDREIMEKLYDANNVGVKIWLIVRGICCLVPGVEGMSENIKVVSIVDRFLEHARIYIFHNGGDEKYFLASADLMTRNLSRRIEVAFPVFNEALKHELKKIIDLQLQDDVKARIIDKKQSNKYKRSKSDNCISSQVATYEYLRETTGTP
ncbi:MAG: polyphosphate kinase 1 [Ignavibacteriae bacterium]|nr:polyphosphate kinase 1 [Ignavibacteriota bacterium]